jgi:hypothetical protein
MLSLGESINADPSRGNPSPWRLKEDNNQLNKLTY